MAVERLEDRSLLAVFNVMPSANPEQAFREAVNSANATPGSDEIHIDSSYNDDEPNDAEFSITLTSAISVTDSVHITSFGGKMVSISAGGGSRLFEFGGDGANNYTLTGLNLANGVGQADAFCEDGQACGGAIVMNDADDTLTIERSVIRNSSAVNGGGIHITEGTLNIDDSSIVNNTATGSGGGLSLLGDTSISNSTISSNQANEGGGLFADDATITLNHVTLANNSAPTGANVFAETVDPTSVTYRNTLFALPQGGGSNVDYRRGNGSEPFLSLGNNMGDDGTGFLREPGDRQNIQVDIKPLANNGRHLLTHALSESSPARDAAQDISDSGILADQRLVSRPQFGVSDVGSYEHTFSRTTVTLNGLGRVTDYVDVTSTNDNDGMDVKLLTEIGTFVSPGPNSANADGAYRISLAGLPEGRYQVWADDITQHYTIGESDGFGEATDPPDLPAVDLDGNGDFEFASDGITLLAYALGARGDQLAAFLGTGGSRSSAEVQTVIEQLSSAIDLDGDGEFVFANDGIILLAHSLGIDGPNLDPFRSENATFTGAQIATQIDNLLLSSTPPSGRTQTPDEASVGFAELQSARDAVFTFTDQPLVSRIQPVADEIDDSENVVQRQNVLDAASFVDEVERDLSANDSAAAIPESVDLIFAEVDDLSYLLNPALSLT